MSKARVSDSVRGIVDAIFGVSFIVCRLVPMPFALYDVGRSIYLHFFLAAAERTLITNKLHCDWWVQGLYVGFCGINYFWGTKIVKFRVRCHMS